MTLAHPNHIKLFSHQEDTARFLIARRRAFVHSDIGTGKTLSAATALATLIERGKVHKALIVAPKSTLNFVWERAFFVHFQGLKVKCLTGERRKRLADLACDETQVFIINPEALTIIKDEPAAKSFDAIIVDEHTYFKNARTKRWKALHSLVPDKGYLWAMSGSPMPQSPTDMYAPMRLLCPERLPRASFTGFRDWSMRQVSTFKWVPKPGIEVSIAKLLDGISIRHTRDECIDLPPMQNAHLEAAMSPEQTKLQTLLEKEALAMLDAGEITALNEAVLVSKLLQVAAGAVKYTAHDGEPAVHYVECPHRIELFTEIVDASDGPVIVFSPYLGPIETIKKAADAAGFTYMVVTGGTAQRAREEAFDAVQERQIDILIAQPSAMSHGLTLTASNVVIWWGLPWSNEVYEQATGRIVRASQTRKQYIVHIISSAYEERVAKKLEERQSLQGTLLELIASQKEARNGNG